MKWEAANFFETLIHIDYSLLKIEAVDFSETSEAVYSPILRMKVIGSSYMLPIIKVQGVTYQDKKWKQNMFLHNVNNCLLYSDAGSSILRNAVTHRTNFLFITHFICNLYQHVQ
jgi:hypothetical protein